MPQAQKIRAVLFYLSLLVFLLGLPLILSFALGYKFNPRTWRFTKTGIIVLRTQPQGVSVYLDNKMWPQKTPVDIGELLPGKYYLRLESDDCYPWISEVFVEADKVTRLDKIILFPLRPQIKKLNNNNLLSFCLDAEGEEVYYVDAQENSIYRTDPQGERPERVADYLEIRPAPLKWKVSPDARKLIYFNSRQIAVIFFDLPQGDIDYSDRSFVLDFPERKIVDIFWHSDSYHIILVSAKDIEVMEARADTLPVGLVKLNKKNATVFYEQKNDTLYFLDTQKASDGKLYDNLYRLTLKNKISPFGELKRPGQGEGKADAAAGIDKSEDD